MLCVNLLLCGMMIAYCVRYKLKKKHEVNNSMLGESLLTQHNNGTNDNKSTLRQSHWPNNVPPPGGHSTLFPVTAFNGVGHTPSNLQATLSSEC